MTACWFCEERSADQESAFEFKMYQHVPPYQSTTISVDRCEECKAIHTRIQEVANRLAVVVFVIPTALCLLSLLIGYISDRKLPWGIAAGIATIAAFIIVGVGSVWERRMQRSRNMRLFRYVGRTKHPRVKELKEQGWKPREKAVRPAEKAEPKQLNLRALLQGLPVIQKENISDRRQRIMDFTTPPHPCMFSGSIDETMDFVAKMVRATESYILSCEGIVRVKRSFLVSSLPVSDVLEIQYEQSWDDGTSAIYSENVVRIGDDQYDVFGSEKSATRMKVICGDR